MRYALIILLLMSGPAWAEGSGEALYRDRCSRCHEGGVERAPDTFGLRQLSAESIKAALTSGKMAPQAAGLDAAQLDQIVFFLAGAAASDRPAPAAPCGEAKPDQGDPFAGPHWNGWGVDLAQHRFQPAAMAQLAAADVPRLKLAWAFGFPGANRAPAQPTVVGGRVYVGSVAGKVYALDARTGCTYWTFDAVGEVRTAISIGRDAAGLWAYFGDQRANAYAVDALTGKLRWQTHVDEHPAALITGAPALAEGVLYVPVTSGEEVVAANPKYACCTFRGSVVALDAESGKLVWKAYSITEAPKPVGTSEAGVAHLAPSGVAIWSAPTIDLDKRMVYATTGESYSSPAADSSDAFLAFHLDTGARAWVRQMTAGDASTSACIPASPSKSNCPTPEGPDFDFGSSAILVTLGDGHRALIAGQKSGVVHAIDPDRQGMILWQRRIGEGGTLGGIQWGSAADEHNVYVALSDIHRRNVADGTPGAQKAIFSQNMALDPTAGGGLWALKLDTGEVVWRTPHPGCGTAPGCSPAQSAAVTAIPGVVFSGGIDGHLRAYAAATGAILWDQDTTGSYETVNGVKAHGGALDGPGPVIVGGRLFVNSGFARFGAMPGNVLLTFSVDGQ